MKLLYKGAMSASFTLALAAAPVIAGGLSKPIEPAPQEAQANVLNVPVMKGNVTAANSSSTIKSNGIYQIPTGPGQEFEPISLGMYGTFGNFEQNGFYFTSDRTSDGLLVTVHHSVWDAKTGSYITSFTSGPTGNCWLSVIRSSRSMKPPGVRLILIKRITYGRCTSMRPENLRSRKMPRKA